MRKQGKKHRGRKEGWKAARKAGGACVAEVLEWGHLCPEEGEGAMGRFEPTKVGWS